MYFSVPNVSFEVYSPSFLDKFIESHSVMTQVTLKVVLKHNIESLQCEDRTLSAAILLCPGIANLGLIL